MHIRTHFAAISPSKCDTVAQESQYWLGPGHLLALTHAGTRTRTRDNSSLPLRPPHLEGPNVEAVLHLVDAGDRGGDVATCGWGGTEGEATAVNVCARSTGSHSSRHVRMQHREAGGAGGVGTCRLIPLPL